jgi:hypothetical protein
VLLNIFFKIFSIGSKDKLKKIVNNKWPFELKNLGEHKEIKRLQIGLLFF